LVHPLGALLERGHALMICRLQRWHTAWPRGEKETPQGSFTGVGKSLRSLFGEVFEKVVELMEMRGETKK